MGVAAQCVGAWRKSLSGLPYDETDAKAGDLLVAEFLHAIRATLLSD